MRDWWLRWRSIDPLARSGMLVCSLLVVAVVGWLAAIAWLAVLAIVVMLGVAANAVGVDSRLPGNWGPRIRAR